MNEPIASLSLITAQADAAAQRSAQTGLEALNDYPPGTEAAKVWKRKFETFLVKHSAKEIA